VRICRWTKLSVVEDASLVEGLEAPAAGGGCGVSLAEGGPEGAAGDPAGASAGDGLLSFWSLLT
jgi:hypothetical protein